MGFAWYLKLARPLNLLMVAIGVLVGYLVEGGIVISYGIALAPLAAILATAGGNGLNDYFDREIDRVVHPNRPIPSGYILPNKALMFSIVCFILAIVTSFLTSWICLAIAVLNIGLMIGYEKRLKQAGFLGNLVISYLVASLFLFGGAAAETWNIARTPILVPLVILATLGREVAKDIEDLKGDERSRVTIPMRIGRKKASLLASSLILLAVALSPLPYVLGVYGPLYLYILAPADALFILSAIILFKKIDLGERLAKYGMLMGVGAFLGGSLL